MKMSELKIKDPAMYKAIHDKFQKKIAARNDALKALCAFAAEKGDEKLKAAAALFAVRAASGPRGTSPKFITVMTELFKAGPTVHEDIIFKNYKLGRTDMRNMTIDAIKKAKPAERFWVKFDAQTGVYTLVGRGEKAPATWTGYKPLVIDGAEVK